MRPSRSGTTVVRGKCVGSLTFSHGMYFRSWFRGRQFTRSTMTWLAIMLLPTQVQKLTFWPATSHSDRRSSSSSNSLIKSATTEYFMSNDFRTGPRAGRTGLKLIDVLAPVGVTVRTGRSSRETCHGRIPGRACGIGVIVKDILL